MTIGTDIQNTTRSDLRGAKQKRRAKIKKTVKAMGGTYKIPKAKKPKGKY